MGGVSNYYPALPGRPLAEKNLTYAEVLVYAYITVKFQLRSSINVQLTESSLCNRFCIEKSSKMEFGGEFWRVGVKLFGGNSLGMQRSLIYAFSDIFGSDLTCRTHIR